MLVSLSMLRQYCCRCLTFFVFSTGARVLSVEIDPNQGGFGMNSLHAVAAHTRPYEQGVSPR